MDRNKVKTQDIVSWFTRDHLTLRQIGALAGMTAAGVHKRLRRAGVGREDGTWAEVSCDMCGKQFRKRRASWRRSKEHFCGPECLHASLENPGYKPWRQGQRLAVAIVAQYHKIQLGEIVHHKDGDNRNNNLANLAVYASHSEHLKAHHGKSEVKPIWDGALI